MFQQFGGFGDGADGQVFRAMELVPVAGGTELFNEEFEVGKGGFLIQVFFCPSSAWKSPFCLLNQTMPLSTRLQGS